ncbi:bifunctional hydroxymethylpyrimidine kinase/phosphomethylpyrimidine kinase [Nocardioides immobilis]|uniref:Bifunctional hydroxymethylpyrimidine kinase/phosphomethylpyrimidine kinase n=1 Tax=Nocardioides immobilis TaxID=2049295 RepID=A0A417XVT9_9ACTN|nr:bifunctional hydroxymethylpyrimidine kinase/phosphomethylpyrimidine kinase [Nocardioides immobilis]RHW24277.1 bifunctional hydroxymethylpyrimidine kinase/phosphomethylpyrimidine kinase [Nocardioides immobilis]
MTPPVVLAVAATDPGGGAGLAADLATFAALGVHGGCVVTAITVQDTRGVHGIHPVPADVVAAQLDAVLGDLPVAVIKTGMLATPEAVRLLAERVVLARVTSGSRGQGRPLLVVDPVLRATTGATLADAAVVAAYREHLLPLATVVTPNADEDAVLGRGHGAAVLRTGSGAPDVLHRPGREPLDIPHARVATTNDHGTGCTHASALAAYLALGHDLATAAHRAADFTSRRLATSSTWDLGRGRGPIAHISTSSMTETEGVTA